MKKSQGDFKFEILHAGSFLVLFVSAYKMYDYHIST